MSDRHREFQGSIPDIYDTYIGKILMDVYGADLADRVDVAGDARVLELAAGTGVSTRRLRDALPPSAAVIATDLNDPMLDVAWAKFAPGEKVEFQPADATALPYGDGEFDAVTCQFGVMFFPDKAAALAEVRRVLKPGGTFLFNVGDALDRNPLPGAAAKVIMGFFPDGGNNFYEVPFGFHDQGIIGSLLEDVGFKDVEFDVCRRDAVAETAAGAAYGFVKGNPMILEIRNHPEIDEDAVVDAVAVALRELGGDAPMRTTMQAIVVTAR
jgi:ubiquinone/menaquinone biosynthesis C-methylase UbiE